MLRIYLVLSTLLLYANSRRQFSANPVFLPRCKFNESVVKHEEKLVGVIESANFVFTGKVMSDIQYPDNNTLLFTVLVRRYFKNNGGLGKNQEVRVLKTLYPGEGIKCRQVLRSRYTAIFIGRKPQKLYEADVHLTINPVPVTLTNLDRVSDATKDEFKYMFEKALDTQHHAKSRVDKTMPAKGWC